MLTYLITQQKSSLLYLLNVYDIIVTDSKLIECWELDFFGFLDSLILVKILDFAIFYDKRLVSDKRLIIVKRLNFDKRLARNTCLVNDKHLDSDKCLISDKRFQMINV